MFIPDTGLAEILTGVGISRYGRRYQKSDSYILHHSCLKRWFGKDGTVVVDISRIDVDDRLGSSAGYLRRRYNLYN